MSYKIFCDLCGLQLGKGQDRVSRRITRRLGRVSVSVIVGVSKGGSKEGTTWNHGNVCAGCVVDVVKDGIDIDER